ncbi:hypothetical protein CVT26_005820 [Gymnopilus dilepis]|uniref:Nephrocystin 3-like N-terminal domain-containing protein n=1 Tax=Gymnopilus dilepis TaxID=231916 RepID=A0A409VNV4_9AGAR|nr:hypothetical protein CVT26_005820 [Gymnopilus dilepis]
MAFLDSSDSRASTFGSPPQTSSAAGRRPIYHGDNYDGPMNSSIIGGRENFNQINVHNHGLGLVFDRFCTFVAANAMHNSIEISEQPKCHPGTRIAILDYLNAIAEELSYTYPMIWLHGPAGAGKSAIERTIAQLLFERGLLIASFFFFRSSLGRNNADRFAATIAYQVALAIPATRPYVLKAFEGDPLIFSKSLRHQINALVVSPINIVCNDRAFDPQEYPRIFVIDGLDECSGADRQAEVLLALRDMVRELRMPVAIFIASRPEHNIRFLFDGQLCPDSSTISLNDSFEADADINAYLLANFDTIRKTHPMRSFLPPAPWPSTKFIRQLVKKASGQFIYASTVIRFIQFPEGNPEKRLKSILAGGAEQEKQSFQQLDNLYTTILRTVDEDVLPITLRVLGCLLLNFPKLEFSVAREVELFLGLEFGDVQRLFFRLVSLVSIKEDGSIQFFHASLSDYLFDSSRSGPFWVDMRVIYAYILERGIRLLSTDPALHWLHTGLAVADLLVRNGKSLFSEAILTRGLKDACEAWNIGQQVYEYDPWLKDLSISAQFYFLRDICPAILDAYVLSPLPEMQALFSPKHTQFKEIVDNELSRYLGVNIGHDLYLFSTIILDEYPPLDGAVRYSLMPHVINEDTESFYLLDLNPFPDSYEYIPGVIPFIYQSLAGPKIDHLVSAGRFAELALAFVRRWQSNQHDLRYNVKDACSILAFLLPRASFHDDLARAIMNINLIFGAGVPEEFDVIRRSYTQSSATKQLHDSTWSNNPRAPPKKFRKDRILKTFRAPDLEIMQTIYALQSLDSWSNK